MARCPRTRQSLARWNPWRTRRQCADLFQTHREEIDGVLVTLPNFGDERAVANTLRWAGLKVPVLIHAFNDTAGMMTSRDRRDSFCGKMSVCNNLRQYGISYSLTKLHTMDPGSPDFQVDLRRFAARVQCSARKLKHRRASASVAPGPPLSRLRCDTVREVARGQRHQRRNLGLVRSPRLGQAAGG